MMSVTFLSGASLGGCARASGRGSEGEVVRRGRGFGIAVSGGGAS